MRGTWGGWWCFKQVGVETVACDSGKIRDAEIRKVPFMIIIGEKEVKEKTLSIRRHGQGDLGEFDAASFCALIQKEVEEALAAF
jgi:threonyl-tRNA synthetase